MFYVYTNNMDIRLFPLLFFIAVCFIKVSAFDLNHQLDTTEATGTLTGRGKREFTQSCDPGAFMRVRTSCCSWPMLIPKSSFYNCTNNIPWDSKLRGPSVKLVLQKQDPFCMMTCVMKSNGMLTDDGDMDFNELNKKFMANAGENWGPVIEAAINKCTAFVSGLDDSTLPTPPPNVKACKPHSTFFMVCLKRHMSINCPESATMQADNCAEDMASIKLCDPLKPFNLLGEKNKVSQ